MCKNASDESIVLSSRATEPVSLVIKKKDSFLWRHRCLIKTFNGTISIAYGEEWLNFFFFKNQAHPAILCFRNTRCWLWNRQVCWDFDHFTYPHSDHLSSAVPRGQSKTGPPGWCLQHWTGAEEQVSWMTTCDPCSTRKNKTKIPEKNIQTCTTPMLRKMLWVMDSIRL